MPCYHPISCWQTEFGRIVFNDQRGDIARSLEISCGRCIGCRLERSRQWAIRCMHEAQMHKDSVFVTLTYNDDHFPDNGSLCYRDYQLFMKRLRRALGPTRFYMCGEYGETTFRPHFHACLFGIDFPDRKSWRKSDAGFQLYRSEMLEKLWQNGNSEVGFVTFESAAYCARYIIKKVTGDAADAHYTRVNASTGEIVKVEPEFSRMSLKPGIGATWFAKYRTEVFPRDRVVIRGKEVKPPKYYKQIFDASSGIVSDEIDYARFLKHLEKADDFTDERLAVKEEVTKARIATLQRNLK